MYLLIVSLLLLVFWMYLAFTDKRIHYHDQNLSDGKLPIWRYGRCWWYITSNDEKKWYHGAGARASWMLFMKDSFALSIRILDDDGDDITLHIGIPYIVSLWFGFERLPLLNKIPYTWRRNWGYETSIKFHDGSLWIHILHDDMWGTRHPHWKWMPSWIHVSLSAGYKEYKGVGFYVSFDFDRLIFGKYERTEENIGERIIAEIPIEPDNSLGLHYFANFQKKREVRWRSHFPWRRKITTLWGISTENPPLHAGKGENSYDLDDDGILGTSSIAETLDGAIEDYVRRCQEDRKRYGMPSVVQLAQRQFEEDMQQRWRFLPRQLFPPFPPMSAE